MLLTQIIILLLFLDIVVINLKHVTDKKQQ